MNFFNICKANRWKIPTISYTNFQKEYPNMGKFAFNSWFSFNRYWSGRLWSICVKHHQITLDFRLSWLDDMVFPTATKKDRQMIDQAIKDTQLP